MQLYKLNATTASLSDVKEVIASSDNMFSGNGTLLYLDEIQYFNKKQQQTLLEYMEDEHVQYIFSDEAGDIDKKVDIIIKATANNRDNHTAFLIRIDEVEGALMEEVAAGSVEMAEAPLETVEESVEVVQEQNYSNISEDEAPKTSRKWLPILVILCLIAGLLFFAKDLFMDKKQEKQADVQKEQIETPEVQQKSKSVNQGPEENIQPQEIQPVDNQSGATGTQKQEALDAVKGLDNASDEDIPTSQSHLNQAQINALNQ